MVGLFAGAGQGFSVGCNATLERGSVSFSSTDQLMGSVNSPNAASFYSWSELGRQMDKYLYAGVTFMGDRCAPDGRLAPGDRPAPAAWVASVGPELRLCLGDWNFPVYFFVPTTGKGYWLLGVEREWSLAAPVINHQKRTYYK